MPLIPIHIHPLVHPNRCEFEGKIREEMEWLWVRWNEVEVMGMGEVVRAGRLSGGGSGI